MEINLEYKDKYLKYKNKYLALQKQLQQRGGMQAAQGQGLKRTTTVAAAAKPDGIKPTISGVEGLIMPYKDIYELYKGKFREDYQRKIKELIEIYLKNPWLGEIGEQKQVNKEANDLLEPFVNMDVLLDDNEIILPRAENFNRGANYEMNRQALDRYIALIGDNAKTTGIEIDELIYLYLLHEVGKCTYFLDMYGIPKERQTLQLHDDNGDFIIRKILADNPRLLKLYEHSHDVVDMFDLLGHTMGFMMQFGTVEYNILSNNYVNNSFDAEYAKLGGDPTPEQVVQLTMDIYDKFLTNKNQANMDTEFLQYSNLYGSIPDEAKNFVFNLLIYFSDMTQIGNANFASASPIIAGFVKMHNSLISKLNTQLRTIISSNIMNAMAKQFEQRIVVGNPAAVFRKLLNKKFGGIAAPTIYTLPKKDGVTEYDSLEPYLIKKLTWSLAIITVIVLYMLNIIIPTSALVPLDFVVSKQDCGSMQAGQFAELALAGYNPKIDENQQAKGIVLNGAEIQNKFLANANFKKYVENPELWNSTHPHKLLKDMVDVIIVDSEQFSAEMNDIYSEIVPHHTQQAQAAMRAQAQAQASRVARKGMIQQGKGGSKFNPIIRNM